MTTTGAHLDGRGQAGGEHIRRQVGRLRQQLVGSAGRQHDALAHGVLRRRLPRGQHARRGIHSSRIHQCLLLSDMSRLHPAAFIVTPLPASRPGWLSPPTRGCRAALESCVMYILNSFDAKCQKCADADPMLTRVASHTCLKLAKTNLPHLCALLRKSAKGVNDEARRRAVKDVDAGCAHPHLQVVDGKRDILRIALVEDPDFAICSRPWHPMSVVMK